MDPAITTGGSSFNRSAVHSLVTALLIFSIFVVLNYDSPPEIFSRLGLNFSSATPGTSGSRGDSCDYSAGRWHRDRAPVYYTEACPFLDPGFRCRLNGRNDTDYLQWRWKPHSCSLPRFNASLMLEKSRNRRILFVGDSIGRNQWESLVCMLWATAGNRSKVFEKDGNPISKHRGRLAMIFEDYDLAVEYYRAPFLVAIGRPPPGSPAAVRKAIHVDLPNWDSGQWAGADVVVFNAGHWWSSDKTLKIGNYFQIGSTVNMTMGVKEGYRRAVQTLMNWALESLLPGKSFVFFISYSQAHYSNGTWDTGGSCDGEKVPKASDEMVQQEPWNNFVTAEVLKEADEDGEKNVGFINITNLTEQRADGHPSKHREQGMPVGASQDCSHWCLPGVPDAWNEILFANLLSMGYGARKSSS